MDIARFLVMMPSYLTIAEGHVTFSNEFTKTIFEFCVILLMLRLDLALLKLGSLNGGVNRIMVSYYHFTGSFKTGNEKEAVHHPRKEGGVRVGSH